MKLRVLVLLAALCLCGGGRVAAEAAAPGREVTVYFSPGSSNGRGDIAPLQSAAAIDEAFDVSQRAFGAKRILWRGLQEEDYGRNQVFYDDNLAVADYWQLSRRNTFDRKLNRHAVQAARKRGMSIWGYTLLFEFGSEAREAVYGAMNSGPAASNARLRVRHPEWIPVDRHGIRRQSGPLEFAYPGARKALRQALVREVLRHDYDGLMLATYVEVTDLWFEDEFGFSEPIVREYKRRHGVDIRRQSFDLQAWRDLRGEYVTLFLEELGRDLRHHGKKLGMAVDPLRPSLPQPWAGNATPIANAGSLRMDWQTWLRRGIIDEFMAGALKGAETFAARYQAAKLPPAAAAIPVSVLGHPNGPAELLAAPLPAGWQPVVSASTPAFELEAGARGALIPGGILERRRQLHELAKRASTEEASFALRHAAVAELESALGHPDSGVRCATVLALGTVYGPGTPLRIFRAVAERSDYQFASCASQALSKMNEAQTPAILAGLGHASVAVRRVAAQALGMGLVRQASQPALRNAMRDSSPHVRHSAVMALVRFRSDDAARTLLRALNDKHPAVRTAAAHVLGIHFANREDDPMAGAVRGKLAARFAAFHSRYRGRDAEWGYRTVGLALLNMGPQGRAVLEAYLQPGSDARLADYAWRTLYLPPSPLARNVNSLESAEPYYQRHPRAARLAGPQVQRDAG